VGLGDRIYELDERRCLALLATASVGRIGISSQALPAIFPVNFVLHDRNIVFRTVRGTKLQAAVAGAVVAFEVDSIGSASTESWSILVRGVAQEVTDPVERSELERIAPSSWAFDGGAEHLVRIPVDMITGRLVRPIRSSSQPDL
jgi:nitroimidazol reductase NimA-like FMN-containing flavoprotein (pyridoxamine 5'-phosphate oxidase superfamily)